MAEIGRSSYSKDTPHQHHGHTPALSANSQSSSLANLQSLLYKIGAFKDESLNNRTDSLESLRTDLSLFKDNLNIRTAELEAQNAFSRWASAMPRDYKDLIAFQAAQAKLYNATLSSKLSSAHRLLHRVREMKTTVELVGDNLVYIRYLAIMNKARSSRHFSYFRRVTGSSEVEIEVYEHTLKYLVSTGLEFAVFEMLPQLCSARRTFKRVVGVRENLEA